MERNKILMIIADNLKRLINQSGMSPSELSKKCNVSAGSISKITKGNMSITIPMAMTLAEGLGVDLNELLEGLVAERIQKETKKKYEYEYRQFFTIGILSINNKRITCIKDPSGNIIGRSELEGSLDLVKTPRNLLHMIYEAIFEACPKGMIDKEKLKNACLNLVTQSFEFEESRIRFKLFAEKYFKEVTLLADWQISYLSVFGNNEGISLIADKGVSLSFMHNEKLKKLGGWKFPIYDLGGENWLGNETVKHTIEAKEGYVPMSRLAHSLLKSYGKIEKITEICFKSHDADIYCNFAEPLYKNYFLGDEIAKDIILRGFKLIYQSVQRADSILGKENKIALSGSLSEIYKPFFNEDRLIPTTSEFEKASLLADFYKKILM